MWEGLKNTCCIGGGGRIGEKGARLVAEGASSLQWPDPTTQQVVLTFWGFNLFIRLLI